MTFATENTTPVRRQIPGIITGVGASQTMVIRVPYNSTYTRLLLQATIAGVAPTRVQLEAMWGEMRISISGVLIEAISIKQHIAIEEYYNTGCVADTGFVPLNFQRLWMLGLAAQNNPAWGTLAETSFEIQIDQAAASTIDLVALYAETEPTSTELGAYVRRFRVSPPITATGHRFISDLPFIPGGRLYAMHFEFSTPANLTNARFECDGIELFNLPLAVSDRFLLNANPPRTAQPAIRTDSAGVTSGFRHIDFACRNYDDDAVKMIYNQHVLDLTIANAAPATSNIILEIGVIQPSKIKK